MTGSRIQLYNGIILVLVFFGCRLVWGIYLSVKLYQDMWLLYMSPSSEVDPIGKTDSRPDKISRPRLESAFYRDDPEFPLWMVFVYFGSNTILTALNFYWFWLMIQAIIKRFSGSKRTKTKLATQ